MKYDWSELAHAVTLKYIPDFKDLLKKNNINVINNFILITSRNNTLDIYY